MRRLLASVAVFALAACGSLGADQSDSDNVPASATIAARAPTHAPPATGTPAWVAVFESAAYLVRWTESEAGSIDGTVQVAVSYQGSVESLSGRVTGSRSGSALTLTLGPQSDLLPGESVSGEVSNDRLTLFFPNSNGLLEPVRFEPSSIDRYNTAVAALNDSATEFAASEAAIEQSIAEVEQAREGVLSSTRSLDRAINEYHDSVRWAEGGMDTHRSSIRQLEGDLELAT